MKLTADSTVDSVLAQVAADEVKFINLQFSDIVGIIKSVTLPVDQLEDVLRYGKWFDGSAIEGFARIAESDMYMMPDPQTYAVIPWERENNRTARMLCWVYTPKGEPFCGDPRRVLANAQHDLLKEGLLFNTGPELEFFLFRPDSDGHLVPATNDTAGYFDLTTDIASDVRKEMVNCLNEFGIKVETSHHEGGIGQHEIDYTYSDALRAADNAVTMRFTVKAIAQRHKLHATFMPKPIEGTAGNGMHVHQSFTRMSDGSNAFADEDDEYGLSHMAKSFVAGQLHHARAMSAILSPLVNSYKRLVSGFEAPVYISWARVNRSALIRVPQVIRGRSKATRVELRCPDPSCNPYLAFAVMLKCGLDGIKRNMQLPPAVEENLYHWDANEFRRRNIQTLPGSLMEALDELERDEVVQEALGEHIYTRFLAAKRQEWESYRKAVSQWELDRYLEIY